MVELTRIRIQEGIWSGQLKGPGTKEWTPEIEVMHLDRVVEGTTLEPDGASWLVKVPVPPELISDGVQTFLIRDKRTGDILNSFTIIAGDPLAEDIRAEMALLRAELDMLKKAFRRHFVEGKS